MRACTIIVLLALGTVSFADKQISIPTGRKVPFRALRTELTLDNSAPQRTWQYYGLGLSQAYDAEIVVEKNLAGKTKVGANFNYNFLPAFVNVSPGVTAGMLDITDSTSTGRSAYVAITYRSALDGTLNSDFPAETTIGIATGKWNGLFLGTMIPLSGNVRLIGEFDTRKPLGAIEYRPIADGFIRLSVREKQTLWSFSLMKRF